MKKEVSKFSLADNPYPALRRALVVLATFLFSLTLVTNC